MIFLLGLPLVLTGERTPFILGTVLAGVVRTFVQAGLVSGGVFSVVLGLARRRPTFEEMSLPLFAVLGAVAAPLILGIAPALFGTWVMSGRSPGRDGRNRITRCGLCRRYAGTSQKGGRRRDPRG